MASQAALHCAAAVMVLSDGFEAGIPGRRVLQCCAASLCELELQLTEAAQRLAASLQQALNVRAKTMGTSASSLTLGWSAH